MLPFAVLHLIQPRELYGPAERWTELTQCWGINDASGSPFASRSTPTGRPTFNDLFDLCKADAVNVIANSDIYFTELPHTPPPGEVWALSRWDVDADGNATLWDHADSQDAWIINGKPVGVDAPFTMGVPGCDNVLVHLFREAGYVVRNPSKTIKAYHLHLSQYRSYLENNGQGRGGAKLYRLPPPYAFAKPEGL